MLGNMMRQTYWLIPITVLLCASCATGPDASRLARPGAVTVQAVWHGAKPSAIAEKIAVPLEGKLAAIQGVSRMITRCDDRGCTIRLQHGSAADAYDIAFKAGAVVRSLQPSLPKGARAVVYTSDIDRRPDLVIALILSAGEVKTEHYAAALDFGHNLMRLPSTVNHQVLGLPVQTTIVEVSPQRTEALVRRLKATVPDIEQWVQQAEVAKAIEKQIVVVDDHHRILVSRTPGRKADVGDIILKRVDRRTVVRVRDIARIRKLMTPAAVYHVNAEPAILINIFLRSGAPPAEIRACLERILKLKRPPLVKRILPISVRSDYEQR